MHGGHFYIKKLLCWSQFQEEISDFRGSAQIPYWIKSKPIARWEIKNTKKVKKKGASRQQPHYIRWFFSITREGAWGQDRAWRPGDKHELHPGFIDLFFLVFWFRFSLILIFFAIFSFRFFQTEHYGEKVKTGRRTG